MKPIPTTGPIPTHIGKYPLRTRWPTPPAADVDAIRTAARNPTNDNRTVLRRAVRDALTVMPDIWVDHLKDIAGMTVAKVVDSISYGALVDIAAGATASAIDGSEVDFRLAIMRLEEAFTNDAVCHLKKRFDGPSRGYHVDCIEGEGAVILIDQAIANAASPTIPTLTAGATMTSATAIAPAFTIDSTGVATAVASAIVDILGKDTVNAVVEKMFDMSLIAPSVSLATVRCELHGLIADDMLNSLDDLSDDLATIAQSVVLAMRSAPAKPTKANPPASASMPTLDPNLAPAVNALLNQASGGTLVDINGLLAKHAETIDEVTTLNEEIARLKSSMSAVSPAVASTGTVTVDRSTLTYKVVMRKAKDLFPGPNGVTAAVLDFDVVTLDWFDDTGKSVRHPDCPIFDATYQFRLRHLLKFLSAMKFGQNVWLHGHTGTGKTTLAEQIAARLGYPIERLNLDSNLERADIVGSPEIVIDSGSPVTRFREGILPRAMQQPCMFVLDEIDAGRPDVLFVIQRALEAKGLTLTEDGGRTVQPHELFRFVATANSRGQGDEHGWYQGVRPMNLAMLNRFGAFIEVPYLDKDDEERLLTQAYPALSRTEVMEITQFAQEVRVAFKSGEISQTISPRGLHAMAQYFLHFRTLMAPPAAMKEAVEVVVIDAAPADCEQRIRELADRVFS